MDSALKISVLACSSFLSLISTEVRAATGAIFRWLAVEEGLASTDLKSITRAGLGLSRVDVSLTGAHVFELVRAFKQAGSSNCFGRADRSLQFKDPR